jgi:hypothetical protein
VAGKGLSAAADVWSARESLALPPQDHSVHLWNTCGWRAGEEPLAWLNQVFAGRSRLSAGR